jgi:hypothetical protein
MRDREHPHPDLLVRFLCAETTRTETRAVVRHLLAGCRECNAVMRPIWITVDRLCAFPPRVAYPPARRARA